MKRPCFFAHDAVTEAEKAESGGGWHVVKDAGKLVLKTSRVKCTTIGKNIVGCGPGLQ